MEWKQKTILMFNAMYSTGTNTPTTNDMNSMIPSTRDLQD